MNKEKLNIEFEQAVRLLVEYMPESKEGSRKPVLFHDIRVGVFLYEKGYSRDVVLAGVLHDALEFSEIKEASITELFGTEVLRLVKASTKDRSRKDSDERIEELIQRCAGNGEGALILKAADVIDSFKHYTMTNNQAELEYCRKNAEAIFKHLADEYKDSIFDELKNWLK